MHELIWLGIQQCVTLSATGKGFVEKVRFEPRLKNEGVMDADSGDDDKDGSTSEWGDESRDDTLGWRNESGSWFQRQGDRYQNQPR